MKERERERGRERERERERERKKERGKRAREITQEKTKAIEWSKMGEQKNKPKLWDRKYKNSKIVSKRKIKSLSAKKIPQLEKTLQSRTRNTVRAELENYTPEKRKIKKMKKGRDTVQKRRENRSWLTQGIHVLIKKVECANENTMDVPQTRKVRIKRNCWQMLLRSQQTQNWVKGLANATNKIFLEKIKERKLYTYHLLYAII